MNLEYVALIMMIVVGIILFYAIIAIHDIPYLIAKKRNHPHVDAIHYSGWVSMFTLHAIWPFLWIWATIYHADRGYGFSNSSPDSQETLKKLEKLEQRIDELENKSPEIAKSVTDAGEA